MRAFYLLLVFVSASGIIVGQNVGVGTSTPKAKLHIKGNSDTSQLLIDAWSSQSNSQPLIRLRDATGTDLLHIHSDAQFNVFMGFSAGSLNSVDLANQYGL